MQTVLIFILIFLIIVVVTLFKYYSATNTLRRAYKRKDYPQAFNLATSLALQKNNYAQYLLGILSLEGLGTQQNTAFALDCLQKAADQGHSLARMELVIQSLNIEDDLCSDPTFLPYVTQRAEEENVKAQYFLNLLLRESCKSKEGEPPLNETMLMALRARAEAGDAKVQTLLKKRDRENDEIQQKLTQAYQWLTKAANNGLTEAQHMLVCLHFDDTSAEHIDWLKSAVKNNNRSAQWIYADYLLEKGQPDEAESCLPLTEKAENFDVLTDFAMACYDYQYYAKAAHWYQKALALEPEDEDKEMRPRLNRCRYDLAILYYFGFEGCKQDYAKAIELFQQLAKDDAESCLWLGMMHETGLSGSVDYAAALNYYQQAIDIGNNAQEAYYHLALCHYYGKGVARNLNNSLELLKKATFYKLPEENYTFGDYNCSCIKTSFQLETTRSSLFLHSQGQLPLTDEDIATLKEELDECSDRITINPQWFDRQLTDMENQEKLDYYRYCKTDNPVNSSNIDALYERGLDYYLGRLVSKNLNQARYFLQRAAIQGHPEAANLLNQDALRAA